MANKEELETTDDKSKPAQKPMPYQRPVRSETESEQEPKSSKPIPPRKAISTKSQAEEETPIKLGIYHRPRKGGIALGDPVIHNQDKEDQSN